ncbi:FAD-binding oxidoreductase [Homoserinibacter sp. GY 40078]|uniref:FAD-binding oxidoreductase n=1 Tax=Homoserinibacter sp. GY 40078 TaxID=2603275 RepID=UPI0011CB7447|nr:FAD-binding oxidoreductase [Homoserinibacter sp. GY 40078]TXK19071.1 FAD-binding oxidoreductase [Homoserinibacter sp. GY 40078]
MITSLHTELRLADVETHLPGDDGYDDARTPWNRAVELRPAGVAFPRDAEEVCALVRAAAETGLRLAAMRTGHGVGPFVGVDLSDVFIVKTDHLTGVTIDPDRRIARIMSGTLWRDVVVAAAGFGLAVPHGSAGDVSAVGFLLGGGLSFYGRRHGVSANLVRSIEIVTADGELRHVDGVHAPELFWALRGGGSGLGIVVAVELELLPYADVYAGMLLWDRERAPEVVTAWARWTRDAPESATTSLRIMSFPPLPELPPFLSGRDLVVIDGVVLEEDERADEVLAELRRLSPEVDTFGRIPLAALLEVHMDPPQPTPAVTTHSMLAEFDEEAAAGFLELVGPGTRTPLMVAEVRHLGGAFARSTDDGGILSRVEGDYALHTVAVAPTPEAAEAGLAAGEALDARLASWATGRYAPTFTERRGRTFFSAEDSDELARIRAAIDPAGLFVGNHTV